MGTFTDAVPGWHEAGVPDWASGLSERPVTTRDIEVDGATVFTSTWHGDAERGVLLLHGGAANARWWDFVAPALGDRQVVSMDFSGHGDSTRRPGYSFLGWADEVVAVARASFTAPPVIIGHSMGGIVAVIAAGDARVDLRGAVAIDSPLVRDFTDDPEPMSIRPSRGSATVEEQLARFRPVPDSGEVPPWLLRYVAFHAVRQEADGRFRWKVDPAFTHLERTENSIPARQRCPIVYFHSEHGVVPPEQLARVPLVPGGRDIEIRELPGVGHNPMLDIPQECAVLLRDVLTELEERETR